jgi:hypothetical protein
VPGRYVYRSWKRDGVVRTKYVGTVESREALEYQAEQTTRMRLRYMLREIESLLEILDDDADGLARLEAEAMRERGYEKDQYRKWKVKRK